MEHRLLWALAVIASVVGLFTLKGPEVEAAFWPAAGRMKITDVRFELDRRRIVYRGTFKKYRNCEPNVQTMVSYIVDTDGGLHRGALSFGDQPKDAPESRLQGVNHFYEWRTLAGPVGFTAKAIIIEVQHDCHFLWWTKSVMGPAILPIQLHIPKEPGQ